MEEILLDWAFIDRATLLGLGQSKTSHQCLDRAIYSTNNKIFYYSTYNFTIRNLQIFLYNFAGKNNNSSPKHKTTKVPITFKRIELSRLKKKKN
jgi:hypothetical protein